MKKNGYVVGERSCEWIQTGELSKASIISTEKEAACLWAQKAILGMPCSSPHSHGHLYLPHDIWHLPLIPLSLQFFRESSHIASAKLEAENFPLLCPLPFLHFYPTYSSPQAAVTIFLVKEGVPSIPPYEQVKVGQGMGGQVALAWGAPGSFLGYREKGVLRSSLLSQNLWLAC